MTETIRHEVDIDTQIAAAYDALFTANRNFDWAVDAVHYNAKDKKRAINKTFQVWEKTLDEVRNLPEGASEYQLKRHADLVAKVAEAGQAIQVIKDDLKFLEQQYTGWSRFFLVIQYNGHIHSNQNCSTCYRTTNYGWLPKLSGLTEEDAVQAHGPRLCSVCFPSAPVEWTVGITKKDKDYCTGSDEYVSGYKRFTKCGVCGHNVSVSRNGKVRKHVGEAVAS